MKVIIAGSRSFSNYKFLRETCDKLLVDADQDIIVLSGTARGVDQMGERYARSKEFDLERYPADWSLGRHAGFVRNNQMASLADTLIAFWDGVSRGTKHMIRAAKAAGLTVYTIHIGE